MICDCYVVSGVTETSIISYFHHSIRPSSQSFIPIKERSYAGLSSGGNPSKLFRSLLNPLDSDQLWKMEKL